MKHIFLAAALALSTVACNESASVADVDAVAMPTLLDPNTATEMELAERDLDAGAIEAIFMRRPFADGLAFARYAEDNGMGEVLEDVFIPLPLNATAEEDFLVIPDLSTKMAHEFIEYRPYTTMAQFEGEMGKYVNAEEVARLRRYVTLD